LKIAAGVVEGAPLNMAADLCDLATLVETMAADAIDDDQCM
jgi:hypothetical protein